MSASEKLQHLQQTAAQLPSKVEHTVKSLVPADREHLVDEGKAVIKRYANLPFSFSMENDIFKARNIVKNLKDFPAWVDGKLVSDQIKRADAVAFLTTARLGFVLTGQFGTGLVLSKISEGRWSAPSAIAYIGSGVGFQGGMDLTDYVIILTKAGLESFKSTAQLVLSGDMGLTLVMGRHGSADLHLGKKVGVALGWAASKGMYVGASAQAGVIVTRNGANKKFYGEDVSPDDILSGRVTPPRAAQPLYRALESLP